MQSVLSLLVFPLLVAVSWKRLQVLRQSFQRMLVQLVQELITLSLVVYATVSFAQ